MVISRVGKNPGFFKKAQSSGFFWVLLGFWVFGFYWVLLGFFGFFWAIFFFLNLDSILRPKWTFFFYNIWFCFRWTSVQQNDLQFSISDEKFSSSQISELFRKFQHNLLQLTTAVLPIARILGQMTKTARI